jgi:dCMP deaminase
VIRPSRDDTGIAMARVWAARGTCGRRKVGCQLMDADGWPLSSGYNGPPAGADHCSADAPCAGFGAPSGTGLSACEAVHAEINALMRCSDVQQIHTCYVTASPCSECVKAICNTPCKRIVFAEEYGTEAGHAALARSRWVLAGRSWIHYIEPVWA